MTYMDMVNRIGVLKSHYRAVRPKRIVLHHTAGGTVSGAESALKNRGLGYHFIIDKKGKIYQYSPVHRAMWHAYKNNYNTIGICFVGGGKFGPATPEQIASCIGLCKLIKQDYPSVVELSGHKDVDPRSIKIDPRFKGEPENGINWTIHDQEMNKIAEACDLKFMSRKDIYPKRWKL